MRVGVVGGSIAGCAVAIVLARRGIDVTVFERSPSELSERGFGLGMPGPLRDQLVAADLIGAGMPVHPVRERIWLHDGRELWRQPSPAVAANWGLLWRELRSRVPDRVYHSGSPVTVGEPDGDHALLRVPGSGWTRFDLVVGADGHQSAVREVLYPGRRPVDGAYRTWRGTVPPGLLPRAVDAVEALGDAHVTAVFPGGQAVFYLIPAPSGALALNWGVYAHSTTLPAFRKLVREHLPPRWSAVTRLTRDDAIVSHPVGDLLLDHYVKGPMLLAGDAATLARPHTAAGAVKALQDAMALDRALETCQDLPSALDAYDRERSRIGNGLVELGRRIGRDHIESPPVWSSMGPADMDAWTRRTLQGHAHYLYGNVSADSKDDSS